MKIFVGRKPKNDWEMSVYKSFAGDINERQKREHLSLDSVSSGKKYSLINYVVQFGSWFVLTKIDFSRKCHDGFSVKWYRFATQ